jgi:ribosome-binding protein aMBF1 (putative translation factor)
MARRSRDFLDELIEEGVREDPRFSAMVAAAYEQRVLGERLGARRRRLGLSEVEVAQQMHSTQRIISKIEHGGDVNVSTLRRYAAVLGLAVRMTTRVEPPVQSRGSSRAAGGKRAAG